MSDWDWSMPEPPQGKREFKWFWHKPSGNFHFWEITGPENASHDTIIEQHYPNFQWKDFDTGYANKWPGHPIAQRWYGTADDAPHPADDLVAQHLQNALSGATGSPYTARNGNDDWQPLPRRTADYQGYTNWDTWNTNLMIDNERETNERAREIVEKGGTPNDLRDWALTAIIGPHNQSAIQDAQEWNSIPKHDRLDHNYENFKEKYQDNEKAMDLFHGLVGGPDVEDTEPTLIDPELVNWDEIWQGIKNEFEENDNWERDQQKARDMGLGWATNGGDNFDKMRDAIYRHHGAMTEEDLKAEGAPYGDPRAYFNRNVTLTPEEFLQTNPNWDNYIEPKSRIPIWSIMRDRYPNMSQYERDHALDWNDPEIRAHLEADPNYQNIMKNGYTQRLHDYTNDLTWAITHGRQHPHIPVMQQALANRGYTPEQINEIMQPRWDWKPNPLYKNPDAAYEDRTNPGDWVDRTRNLDAAPPIDKTLDQPGSLTIPNEWLSKRLAGSDWMADSADSWHGPGSVREFEVDVPGEAPGMGDPARLPGSENTLLKNPCWCDCGETMPHEWSPTCEKGLRPTLEHEASITASPDHWVWLDGHVAFGGDHHDIAERLAREMGYDSNQARYISNMIARGQQPSGHNVAVGTLKGGYPHIWTSTVDRNAVWDDVAREHQNGFQKAASLRDDAHRAWESLKDMGGFSLTQSLAAASGQAFFASVAGYESTIPVQSFTPESILDYRRYVLSFLKSDPSYLIGGWIDNAMVYLDLSRAFMDEHEAVQFGRANGQKAIWDGFNNREIRLDMDNEMREARLRKLGKNIQWAAPIYSENLAGEDHDAHESRTVTASMPWRFDLMRAVNQASYMAGHILRYGTPEYHQKLLQKYPEFTNPNYEQWEAEQFAKNVPHGGPETWENRYPAWQEERMRQQPYDMDDPNAVTHEDEAQNAIMDLGVQQPKTITDKANALTDALKKMPPINLPGDTQRAIFNAFMEMHATMRDRAYDELFRAGLNNEEIQYVISEIQKVLDGWKGQGEQSWNAFSKTASDDEWGWNEQPQGQWFKWGYNPEHGALVWPLEGNSSDGNKNDMLAGKAHIDYMNTHWDRVHPDGSRRYPFFPGDESGVIFHDPNTNNAYVTQYPRGSKQAVEAAFPHIEGELRKHLPNAQVVWPDHPTYNTRTSSVPLDQLVYIAEGAMERGGLDGPVVSTQPGHRYHPDPAGVAEAERVSQLASQIVGKPVIVHISNWIDGGDKSHGSYDSLNNVIAIRPGSKMLTLLHECAHALTPGHGHDTSFCEAARGLYAQHLGEEAADVFWNIIEMGLKDLRTSSYDDDWNWVGDPMSLDESDRYFAERRPYLVMPDGQVHFGPQGGHHEDIMDLTKVPERAQWGELYQGEARPYRILNPEVKQQHIQAVQQAMQQRGIA